MTANAADSVEVGPSDCARTAAVAVSHSGMAISRRRRLSATLTTSWVEAGASISPGGQEGSQATSTAEDRLARLVRRVPILFGTALAVRKVGRASACHGLAPERPGCGIAQDACPSHKALDCKEGRTSPRGRRSTQVASGGWSWCCKRPQIAGIGRNYVGKIDLNNRLTRPKFCLNSIATVLHNQI